MLLHYWIAICKQTNWIGLTCFHFFHTNNKYIWIKRIIFISIVLFHRFFFCFNVCWNGITVSLSFCYKFLTHYYWTMRGRFHVQKVTWKKSTFQLKLNFQLNVVRKENRLTIPHSAFVMAKQKLKFFWSLPVSITLRKVISAFFSPPSSSFVLLLWTMKIKVKACCNVSQPYDLWLWHPPN